MIKSKVKIVVFVFFKIGSLKEIYLNKLKVVVVDIFNMVFVKLEGFVNGNLEILGFINDGNKKSNTMDLECGSFSVFIDIYEELLKFVLYMNVKKVLSIILKVI